MINRKIDLRSFTDKGFRYGMIIDGILSVNGHDAAICKINSNHVRMISNHKVNEFRKYVKQEIPLIWDSQKYGSTNVYFVCPWCEKKTLTLYQRGEAFLCRQCNGIINHSKCCQYEFIPYYEQ